LKLQNLKNRETYSSLKTISQLLSVLVAVTFLQKIIVDSSTVVKRIAVESNQFLLFI